MSQNAGTLTIVATPIGNLEDLSPRAVHALRDAAVIACEDTRTSQVLLARHGIGTPTTALHEHNEAAVVPRLVERLRAGDAIALISDAGTPLVSDPGYRLVNAAIEAGIAVSTVPGPSALIAALTLAGLATDRFTFEGFLPAKSAARREALRQLAREPRTMIFYEAKHRIVESLADLAGAFGTRRAAVARELTKRHETVLRGTLAELHARVAASAEQQLGEFVIVVDGARHDGDDEALLREGQRVLAILAAELPPGRAAALAAQITGASRKALYRPGVVLADDPDSRDEPTSRESDA